MIISIKKIIAVTSISLFSFSSWGLEALSDQQLSDVNGQSGYNFAFQNILFEGRAIDGVAEAGSYNIVAADGSSLRRKNYRFSADSIGTYEFPLTTDVVVSDASVNSITPGNLLQNSDVVLNGKNIGEQGYLRIGFPELAGWNNVDIQYDAIYGNPTEIDTNNRNIAAGGTPSEHLDFGHITIDDIAMAGSIDIGGIPEGYKIESYRIDDGSQGAASRQGFLLNIDIEELSISQWLFESEQADGIFNAERDMVIKDLRLTNFHMKSATLEMTPKGIRFAYSNPQPFIQAEKVPLASDSELPIVSDVGALATSDIGHPDVSHAAYNPDFPRADLTFSTQLPNSQMSESRVSGLMLDHLVFNVRN